MILGSIQIPLGPDTHFKLGFAGGPLIVGLILGATRRTGGIVWTMPYGSATTLQQIGLMLLLAAIGAGGKGTSDIKNASVDGRERVAALCDVDFSGSAKRSVKNFPDAKRYHDYREMLDQEKDIDAVNPLGEAIEISFTDFSESIDVTIETIKAAAGE